MNSNAIQDTKIPEIFDSDEKSGHLLGAVATAWAAAGDYNITWTVPTTTELLNSRAFSASSDMSALVRWI
jgi:hypothetical protein